MADVRRRNSTKTRTSEEGGRQELDRMSEEMEGSLSNVPLLGYDVQEKADAPRDGLSGTYIPTWVHETKQLVGKELLGMDHSDSDTEKLLSEHELKNERARKRRFWALLAIPLLLLTVYGVWAVGSGIKDSQTWREGFRWRKQVHEIRQNGREQYLLGIGKADITG